MEKFKTLETPFSLTIREQISENRLSIYRDRQVVRAKDQIPRHRCQQQGITYRS